MTDHLGNTRVVVSGQGEVVQRNDYYAFGLAIDAVDRTVNKYTYNGNELQPETGLLDYGVRQYDGAVGRFFTIDRFSEKYASLTGYQYGGNNPILYVDVNGDSVNVVLVQGYDKNNNTNHLNKIISDLNYETGLTITTTSKGQLEYQKDANGNPIVATDNNWNQLGSAKARDLITNAINNTSTVYAKISIGNSSAPLGGALINLNPAQINNFISGSTNVDSRTLGWGMTFMHEMLHSGIGGGLRDVPAGSGLGALGKVVPIMNTIRGELNSQGGNFGQRTSYEAVYDPVTNSSPSYLPFDNSSLNALQNGYRPPKNSKYIKF